MKVVELKNYELATEEDRKYGIDRWARLFTADTWEELKMIAQANETMQEAAQLLHDANMDPRTRKYLDDHYLDDLEYQRMWERRRVEKQKREFRKMKEEVENIYKEIESRDKEIESRDKEIECLGKEIENMRKELAALKAQLKQ